MIELNDFKSAVMNTYSESDARHIDDNAVVYYSTIIFDYAAGVRPTLADIADRVCEVASSAKARVRAGQDPQRVWTDFREALAQAFDAAEQEIEERPHVPF